jgi:hypothetical protein
MESQVSVHCVRRRNGEGGAQPLAGVGEGKEGVRKVNSCPSLMFASSTMRKLPRRKQRAVGRMAAASTRKESEQKEAERRLRDS